jgi:TonB family protein
MEAELQNNRTQTADYTSLLQETIREKAFAHGERSNELRHLNSRIVALQSELTAMREQLNPHHPSVKRAEAQLAALQSLLEKANAEPDEQDPPNRVVETILELQKANAAIQEELDAVKSMMLELTPRERFTATFPKLISRRDPEYTSEARAARKEGAVELSVTIGVDGTVTDAKVIKPLDLGLDRKAIECVKLWRFTPATRDGQPVTAFASVDVKFRL